MKTEDITKWAVIEKETIIPSHCWVTVQTENEDRKVVFNENTNLKFRVECIEKKCTPIAFMPVVAPEPYELDTYQMAYLYPTEYEMKAWEDECRLAESLGHPAPEKPKEKICVIIPTECNSVLGRPYTTVYCDGQVLKTPTHNVKPIGENQ